MKNKFAIILGVAALLFSSQTGFAADAQTELTALVTKIKADLAAGKKTEAALSDDLSQFDTLLAEHKGEKTDAVARIFYMKALLYRQILDNSAKADELEKQLKTDFKDTAFVANLEKQEAAEAGAKKIQDSLTVGSAFPGFNETDVSGQPFSISGHKGKVLLVDFWATWCGPCRGELPNVIAAYEKHHSAGFDILGVSLDQDKSKLLTYTKEQNMTWPEFFDGQGWNNKLAVKYGIQSIPASYLLDGEGKIIAKNPRGEALEPAIASALGSR